MTEERHKRMKPKRFIPVSRNSQQGDAQAGHTIIELMVTMLISSIMLSLMSSFFSMNVETITNAGAQVEAQQGVRAVLELFSQEARQAGACLPSEGDFIAMDGTNAGSLDSVTIRFGQADPTTLLCIKAGSILNANDGANQIRVSAEDGALFQVDSRVYITPPSGSGKFHTVTSKSNYAAGTETELFLSPSLEGSHPSGSGIYAVEERTYAVQTINGRQMLTLSIEDNPAQPFVDDVVQFDVQYHLAPCDESGCTSVVNLPADDAQWHLVRILTVAAAVQSHAVNRNGQHVLEASQVEIKPRNFL
jgi:Tfp pilus assembly protein PilW